MEYKGIEYLRNKLNYHQAQVKNLYSYYTMQNNSPSFGITIPVSVRARFNATLGWCAKAVDSLADRLIFKGFDNDVFEFNKIFKLNSADILYDSAITSALIASCCFVYISKEGEEVRLQVIEADNATGILDPITNLLHEGYAVLERNESGKAILEAYFIKGQTTYIRDGKVSLITTHKSPFATLVPIIHRPDAKRPFGHSRISKSCIYYQQYAKRTLERADVTAEFYSYPQKYVLGTSQDAEPLDKWKATVSSMLEFSKDDQGDKPTLGQFTTPSMSPFTEQLRTAASGFAGETGLTLDDLGFVSDNPSSSEAIKASHETLRLYAKKAQRNFGSC